MKKLLIVAVVAVASLASCKKDYTCTCTTSAAGFTGTPQVTTYPKAKKSAARANCLSSTETQGGVVYTTTCELK